MAIVAVTLLLIHRLVFVCPVYLALVVVVEVVLVQQGMLVAETFYNKVLSDRICMSMIGEFRLDLHRAPTF